MSIPDDDDWDSEYMLGDGIPDLSTTVQCPYCWQFVEIALDPGGGQQQDYFEDCQICCRTWRVQLSYRAGGRAEVSVDAADS